MSIMTDEHYVSMHFSEDSIADFDKEMAELEQWIPDLSDIVGQMIDTMFKDYSRAICDIAGTDAVIPIGSLPEDEQESVFEYANEIDSTDQIIDMIYRPFEDDHALDAVIYDSVQGFFMMVDSVVLSLLQFAGNYNETHGNRVIVSVRFVKDIDYGIQTAYFTTTPITVHQHSVRPRQRSRDRGTIPRKGRSSLRRSPFQFKKIRL